MSSLVKELNSGTRACMQIILICRVNGSTDHKMWKRDQFGINSCVLSETCEYRIEFSFASSCARNGLKLAWILPNDGNVWCCNAFVFILIFKYWTYKLYMMLIIVKPTQLSYTNQLCILHCCAKEPIRYAFLFLTSFSIKCTCIHTHTYIPFVVKTTGSTCIDGTTWCSWVG